jgi:hypothetical protein
MRWMFETGLYSWFDIASDLADIAWEYEDDIASESDFIKEIEVYLDNFSLTELSDIVENLKTENTFRYLAKGRPILGTRGRGVAIEVAEQLIREEANFRL